jgi:hypothetical protein
MVYDFTANNLMATACIRVQDGLFSKENIQGLFCACTSLFKTERFRCG